MTAIKGRHDPSLVVSSVAVQPVQGVRAGSALLAVGPELLVVGDDAHSAVWFHPATGAVRPQVWHGEGGPLPKPVKPDFECAAVAHDGAVWIFGSGSLPTRTGAVRLAGPDRAQVTAYDASRLYDALGDRLGERPNVEGAVFRGRVLRLYHRAVGAQPDVWFDLVEQVVVDSGHLVLGSLLEVPLHVTDAALLPDGRTAFLATAEDTPDAVSDGPVAGSVLGVIDEDEARWAPLEGVAKAEGLVMAGDAAWVVTDSDDAGKAADLWSLRLAGPW